MKFFYYIAKYETLGCTFWYGLLNETLILLECPMSYPESTRSFEFNSQDQPKDLYAFVMRVLLYIFSFYSVLIDVLTDY